MLDETRLASPRHDLWREENFSVELEISPNNKQKWKNPKNISDSTFEFRKFLNDIFDSWVSPPLFLLLGQLLLSPRKRENRMSFERRASKTSKRGYSDENHGTRVSSPPSSPFFHTVSGTQETGQVSVHSFFSPFYTLSTGSSESFSFSTPRSEFSSPATFVKRWSVKRGWRTEKEEEEDVNVHFYSRLLISVGETGRPSRRSKKKWRR